MLADSRKAIQAILPNAKAEDFYIQVSPSTKGCFYSIVRKQIVDNILSQLKALGFSVIKVDLGPFAVVNLLPLFSDIYILSFAGHSFTIKSNQVEEYSYSKKIENDEEIKV